MDIKPSSKGFQTYQLQVDSYLNQAGAVQNTWYTVLDTTLDVILYFAMFLCTVANETVEFRWTVDGNVYVGTRDAVFGTFYYAYKNPGNGTTLNTDTDIIMGMRFSPLYAQSLKIEIRKTTNAGASALQSRITYGKLV